MARLNIEDSLYKDPDFLKLIAKTGNYYEALGLVVAAFSLAQKYWLEHKCIPEKHWHKDFEPLIDVGLAERPFGSRSVLVRGSEKQFAWIEQKSKAGKKSSNNKLKNLKQYRTGVERAPNAAEPLSSSLSSLYSNSASTAENDESLQNSQLTDRSSTANFNARFDSDVSEWVIVLDEYGLKKKMDRFIGKIKSTFNTPDDLRMFIDEISKTNTYAEIMKSNDEEKKKIFRIEKYTLVALKKEIGVLS